jgi:hypothetical protein
MRRDLDTLVRAPLVRILDTDSDPTLRRVTPVLQSPSQQELLLVSDLAVGLTCSNPIHRLTARVPLSRRIALTLRGFVAAARPDVESRLENQHERLF